MMFSRGGLRGVSVHDVFESLGRFVVRRPVAIIVFWLALLGALFMLISPLFVVAQQNPPDLLPKDSAFLAASEHMKSAFKEADGGNLAIVVLSNENGLTASDEDTYRKLVAALRADTVNVTSTQDFVAIPELRDTMTSKDKRLGRCPSACRESWGRAQDKRPTKTR